MGVDAEGQGFDVLAERDLEETLCAAGAVAV